MSRRPLSTNSGQDHQHRPMLDPGALSLRPRPSFWSLFWTIGKLSSLLVVLAVAVLIAIFVGFFISGAIKNLKDPHGEMIFKVNGTVALSERGVVKPLVGKDQKFDVAVSVWIRAGVEEERTWRESLIVGTDGEEQKREAEYSILETPLFSDVVFRNLSLSDKHRRVDVPLRIPTAKLYVLSTCWCLIVRDCHQIRLTMLLLIVENRT